MVFAEKITSLRNADLELLLTNRGGGIAEAIMPKHKGDDGKPVTLGSRERLPIGALVEKPSTPVLEEFSVLPGDASVQFERALPGNVTLRKKFSLPAPPNGKDNYVAQLEVQFQNSGAEPYTNPGYFVALGSATPIHDNDLPHYTRVTWCIDGKTKTTDVSWFPEQNYPLIGVQKRGPEQFFQEQINNAEWLGVSNQFFATLVTPLGAKATAVWAQRFEMPIKKPDGSPVRHRGRDGNARVSRCAGPNRDAAIPALRWPEALQSPRAIDPRRSRDHGFRPLEIGQPDAAQHDESDPSFVGNYAVAILILTAIIKLSSGRCRRRRTSRCAAWPRSRPKMQELREKFKDDPTKMNAEVMRLYKDYGINPVAAVSRC